MSLKNLNTNKSKKAVTTVTDWAGSVSELSPVSQNVVAKITESKLAEDIAIQLQDSLAFDSVSNNWHFQSGGLWSAITEKKAISIIMKVLAVRFHEGFSFRKLNNVKNFLSTLLMVEAWESSKNLLPVKNGVLNVEAMELESYCEKNRFNWQLPYEYHADAKMGTIKQWLWDASGHDLEAINIIRAFSKVALLGGDVQKFLEVIGYGGTGKGTLIRLLTALIGDKNHAVTDLKELENNRFETAKFYGKRLIFISDSSRYGGELATLKALTGGDVIRLERKNQQQTDGFIFNGAVIIAANESIQSSDYTSGLARRRVSVAFNRRVTDEEKKKWQAVGGIEKRMEEELPGLLNWVLAMSDDELMQAIGGINRHLSRSQLEHVIETNKLAKWLDENLILQADSILYIGKSRKTISQYDSTESKKWIYPNYENWCEGEAIHALSLSRFGSNLIDLCGFLKLPVQDMGRTRKGRAIRGLRFRSFDLYNGFDYKIPSPVTRSIICDTETATGDTLATLPAQPVIGVTHFLNSDTEIF